MNADISYYTDNKNKRKYLYDRIIEICTITLDLDKFCNFYGLCCLENRLMTYFTLCLFIVEGFNFGLGFFCCCFLFVKPCCVCRPVAWWVFHVLCNQAVRKLSCGFREVSVNENSIPLKRKKKETAKTTSHEERSGTVSQSKSAED